MDSNQYYSQLLILVKNPALNKIYMVKVNLFPHKDPQAKENVFGLEVGIIYFTRKL